MVQTLTSATVKCIYPVVEMTRPNQSCITMFIVSLVGPVDPRLSSRIFPVIYIVVPDNVVTVSLPVWERKLDRR
jgi:hypothetical protein